ncbi:hypothetical protein PENSPDRAFT_748016 [Peniophora sp. CONT]|nr:hypothetical protein PENSPDRAFT_748016 [Peniophora sp. CONT]
MQSPNVQIQRHMNAESQGSGAIRNETEVSSRDYWLNALRPRLALLETTGGSLSAYRSRRETTQAIVERELDGIAQAIAMLRVTQNALSNPVHALPDELLSLVFEYTLPASSADKENIRKGRLAFTQVCRRWRTVALECARLWTQIPLYAGQRWMEAFLNRSGTAGISISSGVNSPWPPYILSAFNHVHRATELTQMATRAEHVQKFLDFARGHTPRLRKAGLTMMSSYANEMGSAYLVLPDDFLKHAPILAELRLEEFTLHWPSLQWTQLRSLHIHAHGRREHSQTSSFDIVLQCLRAAAQLEELYLAYCLPEAPVFPQNGAAEIALGHLRYFAVKDDAKRCLALWRALDLPPEAVAHVCLKDRDSSSIDFELAATLLRRHLHRSGGKPLRYLRLKTARHSLELRGWHDTNPYRNNGIPHDMDHDSLGGSDLPYLIGGRLTECPTICINVPSMSGREPSTNDATTLLAAVPVHRLEGFSAMLMNDCRWFKPATWIEILPTAEHLTRLYITGGASVDTLCSHLLSTPEDNTGNTYLSHLRELHLDSVNLIDQSFAGMASDLALLGIIQRTSLQTLSLSMCNARRNQLKRLKERVNVEWRGLFSPF